MTIKITAGFLRTAMLAAGALLLLGNGPQTSIAAGAVPLQLAQEVTPESASPMPGEETSEDEKQASDEAFERFQETIEVINDNTSKAYGGPPFEKLVNAGIRTVKITPSKAWMAVPERHNRNAMMLYRMWRNANQFRPVTLIIVDETGKDYITLKDTPTGLEYRARQY